MISKVVQIGWNKDADYRKCMQDSRRTFETIENRGQRREGRNNQRTSAIVLTSAGGSNAATS